MSAIKRDWSAIIQNQQASGLTIKSYCDTHHLTVSNFYRHKKMLAADSSPVFLPVTIVDDTSEPRISIRLNQTLLEIPESKLEAIIQLLK